MRAGLLRHVATIEQATETQDSLGATVQAWATFATVRASVEDLRGREFFDARHTSAEVTTRIRIRHRAGVTPKMRVKVDGRTFDIQAVLDPKGRKRELELMCQEAT